MKVTGERVVTPEGGFNPTWQRHVAAYALAKPEFGPERVLDLGCGVGHSYHLLEPRETIGVDIDPGALEGQERPTVAADMRHLPFDESEFDSVLSVHSLEHVPDPENVLKEVNRVLKTGGTAVFITPNRLTFGRPDEIIDPFHYVEFDPAELRRLCERSFSNVEIKGIFGTPAYMEIFDEERATLDRVLRFDPLRFRRAVPMKAKQRLYDSMLSRFRKDDDPRAAKIAPTTSSPEATISTARSTSSRSAGNRSVEPDSRLARRSRLGLRLVRLRPRSGETPVRPRDLRALRHRHDRSDPGPGLTERRLRRLVLARERSAVQPGR
ncbi:MAG: class I SAM-dependent methyltransferase [Solirubrobacterales bacterium]|nr:class I SAM-dependent methyltransferase [Solirubrobacterales bacterium]